MSDFVVWDTARDWRDVMNKAAGIARHYPDMPITIARCTATCVADLDRQLAKHHGHTYLIGCGHHVNTRHGDGMI